MSRRFQELSGEEIALLRKSAAGFFASGGDMKGAAALGLTSFCRSSGDVGLSAAVVIMAEAGRMRSLLPLHLATAANLAHHWSVTPTMAKSETTAFAQNSFGYENAGTITANKARLSGQLRFVEGLPADQLLVAIDEGFALVRTVLPGFACIATPGLGVQPLFDVVLDRVPHKLLALSTERRDEVLLALRLLIVARAVGAARRSFDLAVEHAKTRIQFGQPLGRFQAMQHKLAECHVALSAGEKLIATAARAFDAGAADQRYFILSAIAFSCDVVRRAIFEIQHSFGAVGYAEEHEAAWHFRLVHSELVCFGGARSARASLVDELCARHGQIPTLTLSAEAEAYRQEVQSWLSTTMTDELRMAEAAKPFNGRGWNEDFAARMGEAGLIGIAWPKSAGGAERTPLEQLVFVEEFNRVDAPVMSQSAASWIVGPEIIRHGSMRLHDEILPAILNGKASFCLGYSEPEAGSDLASLRTKAVRDGDVYRITGQKLWGTGTEKATHVLLAARTGGDDLPRHKGISLFIIPLSSPGITIVPDLALYGHYFCTQFYDDVVVSADYRLGEENSGWEILGGALAAERILMGGTVSRMRVLYENIFDYLFCKGVILNDALVSDSMGHFATKIEAARQLTLAAVQTLERGELPLVDGAIAKLFTGELGEQFTAFTVDLVGSVGTLAEGNEGVPLAGRIEQELRRAPMGVIGGGAAEVQKTIIAQRGLNLPR